MQASLEREQALVEMAQRELSSDREWMTQASAEQKQLLEAATCQLQEKEEKLSSRDSKP